MVRKEIINIDKIVKLLISVNANTMHFKIFLQQITTRVISF